MLRYSELSIDDYKGYTMVTFECRGNLWQGDVISYKVEIRGDNYNLITYVEDKSRGWAETEALNWIDAHPHDYEEVFEAQGLHDWLCSRS